MIAAETLLAERLDDLGTDATPDRDKLRRAFTRTAENNAPAPPTSANTAVGFSGQ